MGDVEGELIILQEVISFELHAAPHEVRQDLEVVFCGEGQTTLRQNQMNSQWEKKLKFEKKKQ